MSNVEDHATFVQQITFNRTRNFICFYSKIFLEILISCYANHINSIFLLTDIIVGAGKSWERTAVASLMLLMLVVTKSFSGNLMSLLAVRYIPQPFQSIVDVLDEGSVTMIWEANSAYVQYFRVIIKISLFTVLFHMILYG